VIATAFTDNMADCQGLNKTYPLMENRLRRVSNITPRKLKRNTFENKKLKNVRGESIGFPVGKREKKTTTFQHIEVLT